MNVLEKVAKISLKKYSQERELYWLSLAAVVLKKTGAENGLKETTARTLLEGGYIDTFRWLTGRDPFNPTELSEEERKIMIRHFMKKFKTWVRRGRPSYVLDEITGSTSPSYDFHAFKKDILKYTRNLDPPFKKEIIEFLLEWHNSLAEIIELSWILLGRSLTRQEREKWLKARLKEESWDDIKKRNPKILRLLKFNEEKVKKIIKNILKELIQKDIRVVLKETWHEHELESIDFAILQKKHLDLNTKKELLNFVITTGDEFIVLRVKEKLFSEKEFSEEEMEKLIGVYIQQGEIGKADHFARVCRSSEYHIDSLTPEEKIQAIKNRLLSRKHFSELHFQHIEEPLPLEDPTGEKRKLAQEMQKKVAQFVIENLKRIPPRNLLRYLILAKPWRFWNSQQIAKLLEHLQDL